MRIVVKNAKSGSIEKPQQFFEGNEYEFVRCDLTIASAKGTSGVKECLSKCKLFKGKVLDVLEDTMNKKIFVKFTNDVTKYEERYDPKTGEQLEDVQVTEPYNYLMIINLVD